MVSPALESTHVQSATHRLMADLAIGVPGDLGRLVMAMVGVTVGVNADEDPIRPPAGPISWAGSLLELCCALYGAPVERAVPVGACLALLGIASSALDAAQDRHQDLLNAYGAGLAFPASQADQRKECLDPSDTPHELGARRRGPADARGMIALTANASMALVGLAWQALLVQGPRYGIERLMLVEIGQLIGERLVEVCEAQHRDLTVGRTPTPSLEEYDEIIAGKTGQIDGTACEVGAVLAGAAHHKELWRTLGAERAVAQQLYDDYKDFREDLLHGGQTSHPVLYGLTVADLAQQQAILSLLERARSGTASATTAVQELAALLEELGAEYYTLTCMVLHRNRALAALEGLNLPATAHERLHSWVMRVAPAV